MKKTTIFRGKVNFSALTQRYNNLKFRFLKVDSKFQISENGSASLTGVFVGLLHSCKRANKFRPKPGPKL